MLFRLRPEDLDPADRPAPSRPTAARTPAASPPRLDDLSPEEWRVVSMMLADHRRFGEVLAQGTSPVAAHAARLAPPRGPR